MQMNTLLLLNAREKYWVALKLTPRTFLEIFIEFLWDDPSPTKDKVGKYWKLAKSHVVLLLLHCYFCFLKWEISPFHLTMTQYLLSSPDTSSLSSDPTLVIAMLPERWSLMTGAGDWHQACHVVVNTDAVRTATHWPNLPTRVSFRLLNWAAV